MAGSFHTKNEPIDIRIDLSQLFKKVFKTFNGIVDFKGFADMISFLVTDSSNVTFLCDVNSNNVHTHLHSFEGETYNLYVVMERARFYQAQAASSLIELGKQIILLKAHEPHGQFLTAVEELGLAERSARYAMAAAQKFANRQTTAVLGTEKIRALTVLDDVERMSVRELRSALRAEKKKRKEEREAQEAAISQKEQKLNELEAELRYREPPTKEQLAQATLDDMKKDLFGQIGTVSYELERLEELIRKAQKVEGVTVGQLDDWLVFEEPKNFLASIFDIAEELAGVGNDFNGGN